jgi:hypothetical protein
MLDAGTTLGRMSYLWQSPITSGATPLVIMTDRLPAMKR